MALEGYLRVLRKRWITVVATTILGVLIAGAVALLMTPKYVAKTQLFVNVPTAANVSDIYQGNLFAQQRVASYAKLMSSPALAQSTIDALGLDMTVGELESRVTAKATPETVLIDVTVEDQSAQRAADIANTMSEGFVTMVAQLETSAVPSPSDVVVAQRATPPGAATAPQKGMILALGAAFGLVAGFALALLRDRLDKSVRNRAEVEALTDARVLATITADTTENGQLVGFDGPTTSLTEGYRRLGANFAVLAGDPPRVTIITGPADGVEKSAAAANLGRALAEAGNTVVLVDGDMRDSQLSRLFDNENAEGLSSVLAGQTGLRSAVAATPSRGLMILPSGPTVANPSEVLGRGEFATAVNGLRETFDHVIIYMPSLGEFADAVLAARRADGVVLVVRQGVTSHAQLAHAADELESSTAPLIGSIMTAPHERRVLGRRSSKNGSNADSTFAAEAETLVRNNTGAGRHQARWATPAASSADS